MRCATNFSEKVLKLGKMMEEKEILEADQVIQNIVECLYFADGEFIEEIANQVLNRKVEYIGDSMFEDKGEE